MSALRAVQPNAAPKRPKPKLELPGGARPSRALARDGIRPNINRAYVAEINGRRELVASDALVVARIPVAEDVPLGAIPPNALKRIEKGERHEFTGDGVIRFWDTDGTPIDYAAPEQRDLPYVGALDAFDTDGCQVVSIGVDPTLLQRLAGALGSTRGVRVDIRVEQDGSAKLGAMKVTPLSGRGAEGLLMPMRLGR